MEVPSKVSYRARLLRWYLRRRGYVLVNNDRWDARIKAYYRERNNRHASNEHSREKRELLDRIEILEAEVEAHKRIEQSLAERAMRAENAHNLQPVYQDKHPKH